MINGNRRRIQYSLSNLLGESQCERVFHGLFVAVVFYRSSSIINLYSSFDVRALRSSKGVTRLLFHSFTVAIVSFVANAPMMMPVSVSGLSPTLHAPESGRNRRHSCSYSQCLDFVRSPLTTKSLCHLRSGLLPLFSGCNELAALPP